MRYAKIVNDEIVQIETVGNHRGKPLEANGYKFSMHTVEHNYITAQWFKEVVLPVPDDRKLSGTITKSILNLTFVYDTEPKTAEELATEAQAQADAEELQEETSISPLTGVTFAQAEVYIENSVTDLASAKVALKRLAKAILILNKQLNI